MATKAKRPGRRRGGTRSGATPTPPPPLELYTDERVAEFLLSNTVDAADYARAVKLVRKMGLDPEKVDHDRPVGVR